MELDDLKNKIEDLKKYRENAKMKYKEYATKEKEIIADEIMTIAKDIADKIIAVRQIAYFFNFEDITHQNDMGFNFIGLKENDKFKLYTTSSEYTLTKEWLLSYKLEWVRKFKEFFVNCVVRRAETLTLNVLNEYNDETLRLERVVLGGE